MSLFKECDLRGLYGKDITEETAFELGRAMGTMLPRKACVVAGDVRLSTPALKAALIEGLLASGCRIYDVGIVPTPVYYFARHFLGIHGGAMVTASHNPAPYNGLKPIFGPLPASPEELRKMETLLESRAFADGRGEAISIDMMDEYIRYMKTIFPPLAAPQKVVVDAGNGSESETAPDLMSRMGYRVDRLYCDIDGRFPNRDPNPAIPEHLQSLRAQVREAGASFGAAFDGDGDRVSFVDERGRFLPADKIIVLLARELLRPRPGTVVYDLKCSQAVPEAVEAMGGKAVMERSGHTFLKTKMIRLRAVFGGEVSGHYFYHTLDGGDDGLYSALLLGRLLESHPEGLAAWADTVPSYCITPDLRLPLSGENPSDLIRRVGDALSPRYPASTVDGIRIRFAEGWGLLRASVTEPAVTLRFEARVRDQLAPVIERFLAPVPDLAERVLAMEAVRDILTGSGERSESDE